MATNLSLSPDEASERATDELARAKRIIKARPLGQGKYGLLHGRKHYSSDPRWVLRREREARLKRLEAGEPEPAVGAARPKPKKPHHGPLSAEVREERKLRMKVKRLHGGEWPPTLDADEVGMTDEDWDRAPTPEELAERGRQAAERRAQCEEEERNPWWQQQKGRFE